MRWLFDGGVNLISVIASAKLVCVSVKIFDISLENRYCFGIILV